MKTDKSIAKMKVEENTVLGEIIKIEGAEEVLMKNSVPCVTCPMAKMELDALKIGQVCDMYGLDKVKILKELNELKSKTK
ncbi:MAG: hypothetical protein ABII01_03210 [Candidatus Woesearchaeota archaeon]